MYIVGLVLAAIVAGLVVLSVRGVRLSTETVVSLTPDQTWAFFTDPQNLARWDRSVARLEVTSTGPIGVGYTFDTFGPERAGKAERSSYRVSEFDPKRSVRIDLVDSGKFQRAYWWTRVEPTAGGTRIVIDVEYAPKPQYFFLTPVLYLSRGNLLTDMKYLQDEVEAYGRSGRA